MITASHPLKTAANPAPSAIDTPEAKIHPPDRTRAVSQVSCSTRRSRDLCSSRWTSSLFSKTSLFWRDIHVKKALWPIYTVSLSYSLFVLLAQSCSFSREACFRGVNLKLVQITCLLTQPYSQEQELDGAIVNLDPARQFASHPNLQLRNRPLRIPGEFGGEFLFHVQESLHNFQSNFDWYLTIDRFLAYKANMLARPSRRLLSFLEKFAGSEMSHWR